MTGVSLALASAMFYGIAGVTIVKGKPNARGDNGVFLSIVVTCLLTLCLWLIWGRVSLSQLADPKLWPSLALFALAGLFSTVLGRTTMYRATERIGAVKASLFRRLIPVFAVPCGLLLLGEKPELHVFLGGSIIMCGVISYQLLQTAPPTSKDVIGDWIGISSAMFYALAYSLRAMGMEGLADPIFGTFVGALVGLTWFPLATLLGGGGGWRGLFCDCSGWHWATALSLGLGQTLQFIALSFAPVSTVALVGALDLFFSAGFMALLFKQHTMDMRSLLITGLLAVIGSAVLIG